jgi:HTH DNA binding domain
MRQVTVDFPVDIMPPGLVPQKLLSVTSSVRFLRLDFMGFLFTCRVQESALKETLKFLKGHYRQVQKGAVKVSHEGQGIILVSGCWVQEGTHEYLWNDDKGYLNQEKKFSKLMAMYQTRTFFLKSPEIIGNNIRFVMVGDPESIKTLEEALNEVSIHYKVQKIASFHKTADSAFDRLTPQQMRILRLAYIEGYYSVPRKISTELLARLLKMEKGNVGEHLRRAEKNIIGFSNDRLKK